MAFSLKVLFFLIILVAIISNQTVFVNAQTLPSPLKQFKSGILIQDIKCYEGFELVIKATTGNPACVKPTTATRLLSHGWITIEVFESTHTITNNIVGSRPYSSIPTNITSTTLLIPQQNVTNTTSPLIEDIIRNLPHGAPFGNGLVWVNPDITTFTNRTLYVPTFVPLSEVTSNPTILSSTLPNYIKILSVGMSPNPLKVGDTPEFTVTYQNISKKPITHPLKNDVALWFDYSISPQNMIKEDVWKENPLILNGGGEKDLQPNQIVTDAGLGFPSPIDPSVNTWGSPVHAHYQITKSGMLTVTMKMRLGVGLEDLSETIQFNVTATQ